MNLLSSPPAGSGGSFALMTAPAAAGMVAGATAGSGGSFTSAGAPGTPGRSRLSNLGDDRGSQGGGYAAVAADLGGSGPAAAAGELRSAPALWAHMGDPAATSPSAFMPAGWATEGGVAAGYRVPLVPVVLPGGGCAYCPADSLPAGAVVATLEQMAAAAAGAVVLTAPAGVQGPQDSVMLSGGIGPASVDLQIPATQGPADGNLWQQQQQQWQQQQQGLPGGHPADVTQGAASGKGASYSPFLADGPREQAQLQDRAEAIFGQPMVPPTDMLPPTTQQQVDASGAAVDQAAAAAAAALGAAAVGALEPSAGPGWMSQPAHEVDSTGAQGGFSLWEGVVAAAATGGPAGRCFVDSEANVRLGPGLCSTCNATLQALAATPPTSSKPLCICNFTPRPA
jgi:hypothetical protein